jgi:predicted nucleic acid-binding protein
MRLFFLSFPLPNNVCLVYKAKTLLLLNPGGGILRCPIEPMVTLRVDNNILRTVVLSNAPTSVVKHLLAFLKIQLIKQLAVLCGLDVFIQNLVKKDSCSLAIKIQ